MLSGHKKSEESLISLNRIPSIRKTSYDMTKKLGLNNFSSNLIKYILEFFTLNEFVEISKICQNLNNIIENMSIFKEYMKLIKMIKSYPKNIPETLFKENAIFIHSKINFESFLKEEEKIKIYQNYLHFYLRNRKLIHLSDTLRIGEMGIYYLSVYLTFQRCKVQTLNLNYNTINEESAQFLSNALSKNTSIEFVHLNGLNCSAQICKIISEGLIKNKTVEKLEMSYNMSIRPDGFKNFFTNLKLNQSVKVLYFNDNLLRRDGAKIIGEYLKDNNILEELFIERNEIGDDGIVFIANGLKKNKNLEVLNISENSLTSVGLKSLASALTQTQEDSENNLEKENEPLINYNTTLNKLFFRSNNINTNEGSKLLGEIINNNKTISFLDISNNSLRDNLILPLANSLINNSTLETLILETNSLGPLGCNYLCEGLKMNRGVKNLNIRNNSIGFEGAKHISEMIILNKSLTIINLQANLLDEHSISIIADKIGYNPKLKSINLAYNQLSNINDIISNTTLAKDVIIY